MFLITNIAIIVVLTISIAVIEKIFWINISAYGGWYLWILIFASIFWFAWAFISLFISKWMAKKAYKIDIIGKDDISSLWKKEKLVWSVVESLAERYHITMPEVWIYKSDDINAFATWASKNSSLVAVSTGLLDKMTQDEIEWVVGHEMAHILNWDMVTMTLLQWILNTFVIFFARILANVFNNVTDGKFWMLGYYGVVILLEIVFWILASIIAMWFSRYREYKADAWSAVYLWKDKMIKALEALKKIKDFPPVDNKFASMKISGRRKWWFMRLFSSHPDLDDRIRALEDLRV